jgi:hypothetical protein
MKVRVNRPYKASELGLDDPDGVIWGVFVGGCIDERNGWREWTVNQSHAHSHSKDAWFGWICIENPKHVLTPQGKITNTLAHEIAHMMVPNQGHTPKWKREIIKMGFAQEIGRCKLKPL